ncbi:hypothetical protein SERLA73DRAFT_165497 [Serpula lacrymans var. lacrymans S7.3]|uniref:Nuclear condensin complex subunit 3 C-terminal domain-containing protein n=2 Tax=Serpula lacrymans var. lacrymans TaxID=341189 RepID=F8PL42_SERL3|nr:uncharacterized protein SERLADRAFT_445644 [Serpula lacrymans var. lacrymans S7.9]EGO03950.1 hypothetical protein SERLA73DRAFT_165497 [Serpula lacrymans var. lacrymans S7.3]EGO29870.1 hypothetical protein SERLADRAFT_445644 [Serpula lacrymans var. lacrymans S7.9]
MPTRTAPILEQLTNGVPKIFDQAQNSTANHQKNLVSLHKLHCEAANVTEEYHNGDSLKLIGERNFEDVFIGMVGRVLPVKKGTSQADRIIKFVGSYTKFINDKTAEIKKEEDGDDEDTTASRFVARLLRFLLQGFSAKDKIIRYRSVHLLAEMVSHLGEIDEDVYAKLRTALLERIHDRETPIRVQAVTALSKLCGSEDPSEVEDGEQTAVEVLLDILAHDPAAEVRRATLLNLPLTPVTLDSIFGRTRDTDTTMRKLVYSAVLEAHCLTKDGTMGTVHPRVLTIAQRELVIRNGLGDREPEVRASTGSLLGAWVDVARGEAKKEEKGKAIEDDLLALLNLFDLMESTVAEDALLSVFATRADIFDNLEFKDAFWTNLNPERAFLARVFVEHCINTKDDNRLEAALPVVTALAFRIQSDYNDLLKGLQAEEEDRLLRGDAVDDDEDRAKREDERVDREFVIGEMLRLAVNLDYADEIGRRKMFQLVRDMISQDALPESLLALCLDVLRTLSPNERDLIRVVVEVVHELRDPSDADDIVKDPADDGETNFGGTPMTVKATPAAHKTRTEMSTEEQARSDAIDLRCLSLCIGMLERVNGTFEENSTLEGILGELILPAVKSKELLLREKGLVSLGLCCLIARRMALSSFQLFFNQLLQPIPEVLKIRVIQIVVDILMVHDTDFLRKGTVGGEKIVETLLHLLTEEESDKVQALLCIGISKLVLAGMISNEDVLKNLMLIYLSPDTADNQELRQCLSYFFPVYSFSSSINQRRMKEIFIPMFVQLANASRDLEDDQEMVNPSQVGGMFVDWTDPQKAIEIPGQVVDEMIHFDMASDIVKALFRDDVPKEDKKVMCQLLGRLYIPDTVDDDKIRTLKLLLSSLSSRRPLRDTVAKNAFMKFDNAISKKFAKQLEDFNEAEYRQLENLKELFEFLDDIVPIEDGEEIELPKGRARKRRSESVTSDSSTSSTPEVVSPTVSAASSQRVKGKGKGNKKRRLTADGDVSDGESSRVTRTPPPPTRILPKRAAASKKPIVVITISDDDDEDEIEELRSPAPVPKKTSTNKSGKAKAAEVAKVDADIDRLIDEGPSFDSIMDDDDSEDEVDDILAPED